MDQSIEEYKTIRAEILRNFEAMERNLIACITTNAVAIAYGLKESQPLILVLAILIAIYFWIQHTYYRFNVAKLASYIAIYLEGSDTNLKWENVVRIIDLEKRGPVIPFWMRTLLHPYPILLIVSFIMMIWLTKPNHPLLISLVITLIIFLIAKKTDVPWPKLRESWIEAFKKLRSQKQSIYITEQDINETKKN